MTTFYLCKKLLEKKRLTATMLDVFFAAGRLTSEQYKELITEVTGVG